MSYELKVLGYKNEKQRGTGEGEGSNNETHEKGSSYFTRKNGIMVKAGE